MDFWIKLDVEIKFSNELRIKGKGLKKKFLESDVL
jgi:hypothetical protein